MKALIILAVGLLAVGCETLTPEQKEKAFRDSVVGEYEIKLFAVPSKYIFLENGVREYYKNGKHIKEHKWEMVNGQIHVKNVGEFTDVYRINKDKSITWISEIEKGKGKGTLIPEQFTYKKTK